MAITTDDVKKLREETGISVMKCKEALEEAGGDADKARAILQRKSKDAVKKKQDRDLGAGRIAAYVHTTKTVGVLVELSCETDFVAKNDEFVLLAYDIAMHIAAMNPQYRSIDEVSEEERASVRDMFAAEFEDKPKEVREKALEGKVASHFSERVLLEQSFVKDPDRTVRNLVEQAVQKFGERIEVTRFTRYEVGA